MVTPGLLKRRAAFFDQLAAMIAAGVPLTKAMEMAGRNRSIGIPRRIIQELTRHLQEGHTFTDAMQLVSGQKRGLNVTLVPGRSHVWLSDFDTALLSAGEESGRLDTTFKTLARYYNARAKVIRDTINGLIVTVVTLHVFLLVFPVPYLTAFAQGILNNQPIECRPFIIEKIIVFGALYGFVASLIFATQAARGENWRAMVERVFSVVPGLRTALKYLAVARLSMSLDALLSAGVPVIRAWELSAVSCGSPHLKREIFRWTPQLEVGTTPADMVSQIGYFPEMFTQLYQSGEISGRMDETLTHLHTYFEEEGFQKLQMFCRILNFVLYFSMAGTAAISIIQFYLSYFAQAIGTN
jgi:type II secretory pathway component PulF